MAATTLGNSIRLHRKALDLTQSELSRRVGCAGVTIQKIEEGKRRPSKQLAELIAGQLGIEGAEKTEFLRLARQEIEPPAGTHAAAVIRESNSLKPQAERAAISLPAPLTSLIGRENEIAAIRKLFRTGRARLVTLVGPPGVGKTRLAIETAARMKGAFPGGITFIPLASVSDPYGVLPAIAHELGFAHSGPEPLSQRLAEGLKDREILLVLDNFEQVSPAAGQIAALCVACPRLRILTTSRTPLELMGERLFAVEPLPVPDCISRDQPLEIDRWEAVRLFVERAEAWSPGFELNASNAAAVVEICCRLDGLPLAIELAAARARSKSPQRLAEEFSQPGGPLAALHSGFRDLPPRQQTLMNAITWSYNLLGSRLQKAFRSLGVFGGGWAVDSAWSVCAVDPTDLSTLVAHQLVRIEPPGPALEARYAMLETLRAFAKEQLVQVGELEALRARHARHYKLLAENQAVDVERWMDRLEAERYNLNAALQWFIECSNREQALEFSVALRPFWESRGYQSEGLAWLLASIQKEGAVANELLFDALESACTFSWQQGEFSQSEQLADQILATASNPTVRYREAHAKLLLGRIAIEQGTFPQAERWLLETLSIAVEIPDPFYQAAAQVHLAEVYMGSGDLARAKTCCQEGLRAASDQPPGIWSMLLLHHLGEIELENGRLSQAEDWLRKSLEQAHRMPRLRSVTLLIATFAGLSAASEDRPREKLLRAARLWGAVSALRETRGLIFSAGYRQRNEVRMQAARRRLDAESWSAAWKTGRSLTVETAMQEVEAGFRE